MPIAALPSPVTVQPIHTGGSTAKACGRGHVCALWRVLAPSISCGLLNVPLQGRYTGVSALTRDVQTSADQDTTGADPCRSRSRSGQSDRAKIRLHCRDRPQHDYVGRGPRRTEDPVAAGGRDHRNLVSGHRLSPASNMDATSVQRFRDFSASGIQTWPNTADHGDTRGEPRV
jgi:hypothetical protein